MGSTDNSAIMTIDLKWNRFRIHKSTLNKMGNPQYVQFLVNPEEMFIAVLGSDRPLTGGTSNRVKLVQTSRHYSVEFYSNTLLCALVNMIGTLDFQYSYRMSGEVDVANRVAYFSMKTLKKNERRPPSDGQLEVNLTVDGCREPIITWNNIIIDGHNRYEICNRLHIPYAVRKMPFENREQAIVWICSNQLGRRNITEETRRYLIGKQYELEKVARKHPPNINGFNQYKRRNKGERGESGQDPKTYSTRSPVTVTHEKNLLIQMRSQSDLCRKLYLLSKFPLCTTRTPKSLV